MRAGDWEGHPEVVVVEAVDLSHVSRGWKLAMRATYLPCPQAEGAEVVVEAGQPCPMNAKSYAVLKSASMPMRYTRRELCCEVTS